MIIDHLNGDCGCSPAFQGTLSALTATAGIAPDAITALFSSVLYHRDYQPGRPSRYSFWAI